MTSSDIRGHNRFFAAAAGLVTVAALIPISSITPFTIGCLGFAVYCGLRSLCVER